MSNIFKIYLNSYNNKTFTNELSHIIVFIGEQFLLKNKDIDLEKLKKFDYAKDFLNSNYYKQFGFNEYFNDLDLMYIQDFNIKIDFNYENIYFDDTIEIIKFKIINYINSKFKKISYEELYLFSCLNIEFNDINVYNKLSDNNKIKITKKKLYEYLSNIYEQYSILELLDDKEVYDYDDIKNIAENILYINEFKAIGQIANNNFKYIANPFNVNEYNINQRLLSNNIITTNNNTMLFENNITNFTFYICIFQDVLNFFTNKYKQNYFEYIIKLYFPLLNNENILSLTSYNSKHDTLLTNTEKHLTSKDFIKKNNIVDALHKIDLTTPLINKITGSKKINLTIHSYLNYNISLESIFKILNSNEQYPIIKFNPGKKQENLYRIYCVTNNDNKKIPLLNQKDIIKYSKILGKLNTISLIVKNNSHIFKKYIKEFIIEIDITGAINVKMEFNLIMKIHNIEKLLIYSVNPIIKIIKNFITNNQNIKPFISLLQDNVQINGIDYQLIYSEPYNKLTNFNNLKNHLLFLFNTINDTNTITKLKYKYISNYTNHNEKTEFVINEIKLKSDPADIIIRLKKNFNIESNIAAKEIFEEIIQTLTLLENNFNYKKFNIKNAPGFNINLELLENNLYINILNIDHIFYINKIILYFDGIIKLITNTKTNIITDEKILNLFKDKVIAKNMQNTTNFIQDDIQIHGNNMFVNNQLVADDNDDSQDDIIHIASSSYDNDEDDNNFFDLLLDDDEDNDVTNDDNHSNDDEDNDDDSNIKSNSEQNTKHKEDNTLLDEEEDGEDDFFETQDKHDEHEEEHRDNDNNEYDDEIKFGKANPILKRLLSYEKNIFGKKIEMLSGNDNQYFTNYSRLCQSKRQPVIINQEEKDKIDSENPGSYSDIIEYSSNKNNKHYYICPQFWDIKNNIPLTKEQVESGEYGKIINKKTGNIMIFDKDTKTYIQKTPGFLKNTTSDGFCLPCCFNKSITNNKSAKMLKKIKKCNVNLKKIQTANNDNTSFDDFNAEKNQHEKNDDTDEDTDEDTDNDTDDESDNDDNDDDDKQNKQMYIINEKKFPLPKNKLGDLPIILRNFLQFDTKLCRNKDTPNTLKFKYRCLLRHGVEKNKKQSFLACIANVYSKQNLNGISLTIQEFKKILIEAIDIDNFISYNNGNLTSIFLSKNLGQDYFDNFIIEDKYKTANFYKIIDNNIDNQINLFKKIINSYENFINYINNESIYIDYTYLWDIICKPNPKLFIDGINLIILDTTSYDLTENIKVVCPKQNYSNEFLDENKLSLILIKNNNIFEPIYAIKDTLKLNERITFLFSFKKEKDDIQMNVFKKILNIIKNDINQNCIGTIGKNNEKYTFEKNVSYDILKNILIRLKYIIVYQIMNYENKIIGIVIMNDTIKGYFFIPCYPSSYQDDTVEVKFIDDTKNEFYNNYKETKNILSHIYHSSEKTIKSNPIIRMVENNMTIGIITNGNQYVPLINPEIYINDDLIELNEDNYLINDIKIQTSYKKDDERSVLINKIKLETNFFNLFRKILKNQLGAIKNTKQVFELKNIINDISILYFDKINIIQNILNTILKNYVIFENYETNILEELNTLFDCNINNDYHDNHDIENNCIHDNCMYLKSKNICKLKIPKNNLITNQDNETIYYTKLADELIRYSKFSIYLFESENYINLENMKYKISKDEIIITQNSINKNISKINLDNDLEYFNSNYDTLLVNKNNTKEIIDSDEFRFKSSIEDVLKTDSKINIKINKKTKDELEKLKHASQEDELYNPNVCKIKNDIIVKKSQQLVNNFIDNIYEIYFQIIKDKKCNINIFKIILDDYNEKHKITTTVNINNILNDLITYYSTNEYAIALLHSIYHYTKNDDIKTDIETLTDIVYKNKTSENPKEFYIKNIINHPSYYLTYIDLYVLSKIYSLPIIFISTSIININISNDNFLISNIDTKFSNEFYFIKIPSIHMRDEKNFKLIHLLNSLSININNNIRDTSVLQLKTQITRYISENNYDLFDEFIKNVHSSLIETKKLTKFIKLNKKISN